LSALRRHPWNCLKLEERLSSKRTVAILVKAALSGCCSSPKTILPLKKKDSYLKE
jgi:hypothetical protein